MGTNIIKQKAFNERMGILKHRPKHMARGGMVRKGYADGETVTKLNDPTSSSTTLKSSPAGGVNAEAANPDAGLMGSINNALGINNHYQAGVANINPGTNTAQLNQAYTGAQNALNNQTGIANTLSPQAAQAVQSQNQLANQYGQMAQGQGPNPALAQLRQQTGQNAANQAALMAGQRGASSNVGLIARQAAQQGAQNQQQASGQAATLQAQQQINAQQNLANLANAQISQAGQANTNLNSAQQNEQSILQNANTSLNNANVGMQSNVNNVNSQTAAANQNMAANTLGGIMSMASGVGGMLGGLSKGGMVKDHHIKLAEMNATALMHGMKKYDDGGEVDIESPDVEENANLGSFNAQSSDVGAPEIGATASLPEDQTDFASSMKKSGGGGGGGGGMMQMLPMLAALSDGGQVSQGTFQSSHADVGTPSVGSTAALPENHTNFSTVLKKDKDKKKPDDKMASSSGTGKGFGSAGGTDAPAANPMGSAMGSIAPMFASNGGNICKGPHESHVANFLAMSKGGDVPVKVSAGEIYLNPDQVKDVVQRNANPLKIGYKFPGKAKIKGDSKKNDTIPTALEEGGIVIKRTIVNTNDPDKARLFVHQSHMKRPK